MRTTRLAVTLLGPVILLAVGCGSATPSSDPNGNLMIVVRDVPDANGAVYLEGSVRYVRITGGGIAPRQWVTPSGRTTIRVSPGQYEMSAWERVCSANCGNLEAITNRCSLIVDVPSQGSVRIVIGWTVPRPCTIAVDS